VVTNGQEKLNDSFSGPLAPVKRLPWVVVLVAIAYAAGFLTHTVTADHSTRKLQVQAAIFAKEKECKTFGDKERSDNPINLFGPGIIIHEVFYSVSRNTCVEVMTLRSPGSNPSELWVKDLLSGAVLWKHVYTSGDHTSETTLRSEINQFR
jgi:hypothetical protein